MKNDMLRSRMGTVISHFSVREELVIGRLMGLKKTRDSGGYLVFAGLLARGQIYKILVPSQSALYLQVFKLKDSLVQAVVETITIEGKARSRLMEIEAYDAFSVRQFETQHSA